MYESARGAGRSSQGVACNRLGVLGLGAGMACRTQIAEVDCRLGSARPIGLRLLGCTVELRVGREHWDVYGHETDYTDTRCIRTRGPGWRCIRTRDRLIDMLRRRWLSWDGLSQALCCSHSHRPLARNLSPLTLKSRRLRVQSRPRRSLPLPCSRPCARPAGRSPRRVGVSCPARPAQVDWSNWGALQLGHGEVSRCRPRPTPRAHQEGREVRCLMTYLLHREVLYSLFGPWNWAQARHSPCLTCGYSLHLPVYGHSVWALLAS